MLLKFHVGHLLWPQAPGTVGPNVLEKLDISGLTAQGPNYRDLSGRSTRGIRRSGRKLFKTSVTLGIDEAI